MERLFFHDAAEGVLSAAYERAKAHHEVEGGMLSGFEMVVRGDRTSDAQRLPLLGLSVGTATPRDQSTFEAGWELPLRLSVAVEDHRAERGYALCQRLVGLAFHAMFTELAYSADPTDPAAMTQELVRGPEVYGLRAGQVEPVSPVRDLANVYGARAFVLASLRTTF